VYITIADEGLEGFDLIAKVKDLTSKVQTCRIPNSDYEGLVFPMIKLKYQPDISWLLEMEIRSDRAGELAWFISQALQETELLVNEKGFVVRDTVAVAV
jgi:hypothetical protein